MPKINGLTLKMKNFCYAYARTGNAGEAYLEAYDSHNPAVAASEGSKLLRRDDITEFLRELDRPTINKIANEREKKRKIIWDRIDRSIEKGDEAAIARYMDILNKMDAEYVNINRNVEDTAESLRALSDEQLRDLLNKPVEPTDK